MANFTKAQVQAACMRYGPQLNVPNGLDPVKVMCAIAANESTYGENCGPRHESAWDVGGPFAGGAQAALLTQFGSAAACSYGPWQMIFPNFRNVTVDDLLTNLDVLAQQFVRFFNAYVIADRGASTLAEIGQVWNAGHVLANPGPGVVRYCQDLQAAYDSASSDSASSDAATPPTEDSIPIQSE